MKKGKEQLTEMHPKTISNRTYYINKILKQKWDSIKDGKLKEIDEDRIYVVDGRERSGKSLFTIQQAAYIDPSILKDRDSKGHPKRITFSVNETLEIIRKYESNHKETKVIIWDEAFRGMSSKAALSKENKKVNQVLMEMGQKNMVLFIVSPFFFLLEFYSAVLRSNALFHIIKKKNSRERSFRIFNYAKKAKLYNIGVKKGWKYSVSTRYRDKFFGIYPGGDEFEAAYRAKKRLSIVQMGEDPKKLTGEYKYKDQRDRLLYLFKNFTKLSSKNLQKEFQKYNVPLRSSQIDLLTREIAQKLEEENENDAQYIKSNNDYFNYKEIKKENNIT